MVSKYFAFFVFIITWTYLIETTLGSAGWCFQCNSNDPGCQLDLSAFVYAYNRVPCNGQCYVRVYNNIMYRGCSWEHGYMTPLPALIPINDQNAVWVFCDTPLCNANANMSPLGR